MIRRTPLFLALLLAAAPAARAVGPSKASRTPTRAPARNDPKRKLGPALGQFAFAVECQQDGRCEGLMVEEAEKAFMEVCRECDTEERCEAARTAIRAGNSVREMKLCE